MNLCLLFGYERGLLFWATLGEQATLGVYIISSISWRLDASRTSGGMASICVIRGTTPRRCLCRSRAVSEKIVCSGSLVKPWHNLERSELEPKVQERRHPKQVSPLTENRATLDQVAVLRFHVSCHCGTSDVLQAQATAASGCGAWTLGAADS